MYRVYAALLATCFLCSAQSAMSESESRWGPYIQRFEGSDKNNPPLQGAILFVGSSSILYWRTLTEDMAPLKVINRGFGGSQMFELNMFRDRIVTNYKPRAIVVYEGDNDVAAGKNTEEIIGAYEDFVQHIDKVLPDSDICFISAKPSIKRAHMLSQQTEVNERLKSMADSRDDMCYLDVAKSMFNEKGEIRAEIFVADNLHPNAAGYKVWKDVIKPVLISRYGDNAASAKSDVNQ